MLEIKLQITVLVMPHLKPDQILAVLRNIEKDVSEYDDNRSESDANESGSESDASYRFELNYGDNADVDKYHFCIRFVRVRS